MQKSSGSAELFGRTRERKQNILMDEKMIISGVSS